MARQFGIITTTTGISGIVVNSFSRNKTAEIAEARNEKISVTGLLDAESITIEPGSKLTLGEKDYIIESVDQSETNTGYVEVTLSARTADSAQIEAYGSEA